MSLSAIAFIILGGVLALEGALWAIFPSQLRDMYREMMSLPDGTLHRAGLVSVAFGVAFLLFGVKLAS